MATGRIDGDKAPSSQVKLAGFRKSVDEVKLADGKVYKMVPLDINLMVEFEDHFGGASAAELLGTGRLKYTRYLVFLRLQGANPEMTEDQVGKLITMDVLNSVRLAIGV